MPIVTNGLEAYWHHEQGVNGSTWENIAPATIGSYNATLQGAIKQTDGIYFDGIDDGASTGVIMNANNDKSFSFDIFFLSPFTASSIDLSLVGTAGGSKNTRIAIYYASATSTHKTTEYLGSVAKYHNTTFQPAVTNQLTVTFNHITRTSKVYQNGQLFATNTLDGYLLGQLMLGMGMSPIGQPYPFSGYIKSIKYYTKALSDAEISQNTQVGTSVGLTEEPDPTPTYPSVNFIDVDTYKVSRILGFDLTTVRFKFDKDVTEWKVNLLGTSHDTGTLLDSGASLTANTEGFSVVYGTELSSEGQNRINVYGKDADGNWTPYTST
jgi:Concanavalin A-like lectin/glucanases superfamily